MIPDVIAGLANPEPAVKPPAPPVSTARFMQDMTALQRAAWPAPAHVTAVKLAGILDALERADVDASGYLIDQHLALLFKLMRGQG